MSIEDQQDIKKRREDFGKPMTTPKPDAERIDNTAMIANTATVTPDEMEAAEKYAAEYLGKRLERAENFCRITNVDPTDVCPGILKDFADLECKDISDLLNRLLPVVAERALGNNRLTQEVGALRAENERLKADIADYEKRIWQTEHSRGNYER